MKHTPTPWKLHYKGYRPDTTNGGEFVPLESAHRWIADIREPKANADYIVACVNAFHGSGLEAGDIPEGSVRRLITFCKMTVNMKTSKMGTVYELPRLVSEAEALLSEISSKEKGS